MSEQSSMPALGGLENEYEIRGELRGTDAARYYIGRSRGEPAAEVAILVVPTAKNSENNALSHFAADAQILERGAHPALPRVLGTKWLGSDGFAVVSERIFGETLDELLERGERFTNPRIAMVLQEVSAALDWAREAGVVHRGVTPETLFFERGTNRARVTLTPTPIPITGVPDACGDARTLGMLAWAFLTGKPYTVGETRSLGEVAPNLATRIIDATDKMIRCKDHADAPDVGTFLGIVAAGDVLKQAEVELAAQKEEYDEQHAAAIRACELQREATEQHAAEQASMLAGEREEFQRMMADERAAVEAERAQMQAVLDERKERLAAVRAELDQQRVELERRLAELEQYRADVEKVRDDALAAREAAKAATAKAAEAAAAHAAAVKAAEAAAQAAMAEASSTAFDKEVARDIPRAVEPPAVVPPPAPVPELEPLKAQKLAKPPKAPKWGKMEPVDLEHADNVTVESIAGGRPRWLMPAGIATLVLILVAVIYGATHRRSEAPSNTIRLGKSTVVPTAPMPQTSIVPRGGFLTQSAGGALSPRFHALPGAPATDSATSTAATATTPATTPATTDSAARAAVVADSIAAARARRAARAEAARAEARRRPATQAEIDSLNAPASTWNTRPRPASVVPPVANPVGSRPDSGTRRDSVVRRDSIRPDTTHKKR